MRKEQDKKEYHERHYEDTGLFSELDIISYQFNPFNLPYVYKIARHRTSVNLCVMVYPKIARKRTSGYISAQNDCNIK